MSLATLVHGAWTVTPAVLIALLLLWYWVRLGRKSVPPSRRRIRRLSIVILLISLPMFVSALSFVDPTHEPRRYVMTWSFALLMMMIVLAAALLDMVNSLRLHQKVLHEDAVQAAQELAHAMQKRKEQERGGDARNRDKGKQR